MLRSLSLGVVLYEDGADGIHFRHFYAHEYPELLVRDVKTMFGKDGGAYGVIRGRAGMMVVIERGCNVSPIGS